MELTYDTCMETVLRVILKRCQISNAMWAKDENGRMYQVNKHKLHTITNYSRIPIICNCNRLEMYNVSGFFIERDKFVY